MSFFGKNIKKIRSVKHMSQLEFAALFDLKRGTLGAYEEGRSEPKIDTIIKVSKHFKVSTDQLLTGELTVNQLLNFGADIHEHVEQKNDSNIISIPLVDNAKINSLLVDTWDNKLLSDATPIHIPTKTEVSLAFQYSPQLGMQYTSASLSPGDILFVSDTDANTNSENKSTYVVLYMKQLLLIDGTLTNGTIQSTLAPPIPAQDCAKIWKVAAKLNTNYQPQNSETILDRLTALEREVKLLKSQS